jgi:hypothetical protein
MNKLIWYGVFRVLELNMGKWKCLWCSKVLEGESFMDLIAASMKEEKGQHVHGWENVMSVDIKATAVVTHHQAIIKQ